MVYGMGLLNKNKSWDDLKKKSAEMEEIYRKFEEFKSTYINS
jgi:hypothetical protein